MEETLETAVPTLLDWLTFAAALTAAGVALVSGALAFAAPLIVQKWQERSTLARIEQEDELRRRQWVREQKLAAYTAMLALTSDFLGVVNELFHARRHGDIPGLYAGRAKGQDLYARGLAQVHRMPSITTSIAVSFATMSLNAGNYCATCLLQNKPSVFAYGDLASLHIAMSAAMRLDLGMAETNAQKDDLMDYIENWKDWDKVPVDNPNSPIPEPAEEQ